MNHGVSTEFRHDDDEIDLIELLLILVREKKTIATTTILVTFMALGAAFFERNVSKKVEVILTPKIENFKQSDILIGNVLERTYTKNDIRGKNKISLDEFRDEFKITGIIPKEIEEKRDFLAKSGGTLEYTPTSYKIDLRVGSIAESSRVLENYVTELNSYYRSQKESTYKFKSFDASILDDSKYNYEDYIAILESRKGALKELIAGREREKLNYVSYGFGYRELQIQLQNLENIRIADLKNYLLATNIVRNKEKFSSEFINRKFRLETDIKEKKEVANNYKNLLNSYKIENSNMVIPKGVKITLGENEKEKYYTELMDNYLKTEKEVLVLEETLKELI
ncbi:MAG: Wzz/FepE/Etk N-terminal domain-containing protein, partial [Peptostreptococcaceae bacterium]